MTSGIKYQWLLFAVIWIGCFSICYMNVNTVAGILDNREKKETLRKDTIFWKQNSKKIAAAIEQKKQLSHETESLKLGMVFINDLLSRLDSTYNLAKLKIEMDSQQSTGESMPVKITFSGTLKNGLDVINNIQSNYPFLPINRVKMEEDLKKEIFRFDILLDYKYSIAYTE